MIARLVGTIVEVRTEELVIDVSGVGYLVAVPASLITAATVGDDITVSVSTVVREDAFLLYGFTESAQREAFELLRGVSRIGPKNAMAMLSTMSVEKLASAISAGDTAAIAKAPGVGKRSAERICLELKNKVPAHFSVAVPALPPVGPLQPTNSPSPWLGSATASPRSTVSWPTHPCRTTASRPWRSAYGRACACSPSPADPPPVAHLVSSHRSHRLRRPGPPAAEPRRIRRSKAGRRKPPCIPPGRQGAG